MEWRKREWGEGRGEVGAGKRKEGSRNHENKKIIINKKLKKKKNLGRASGSKNEIQSLACYTQWEENGCWY